MNKIKSMCFKGKYLSTIDVYGSNLDKNTHVYESEGSQINVVDSII